VSETQERDESTPDESSDDRGLENYGPDGDEDGEHDYVDRSKIDFDPADGLYSGTAVDGTSEIPGPHDDASDEAEAENEDSAQEGDDAG
jgi:hypothetical protein